MGIEKLVTHKNHITYTGSSDHFIVLNMVSELTNALILISVWYFSKGSANLQLMKVLSIHIWPRNCWSISTISLMQHACLTASGSLSMPGYTSSKLDT